MHFSSDCSMTSCMKQFQWPQHAMLGVQHNLTHQLPSVSSPAPAVLEFTRSTEPWFWLQCEPKGEREACEVGKPDPGRG